MANYEQGQTTNATPLLMHVVSMGTEAGTIQKEIHWSAFTSATECAITPSFPAGTTYHVSSEPTTEVAIGVSAKTVSGFTLAGAATVRCRVHLVV